MKRFFSILAITLMMALGSTANATTTTATVATTVAAIQDDASQDDAAEETLGFHQELKKLSLIHISEPTRPY